MLRRRRHHDVAIYRVDPDDDTMDYGPGDEMFFYFKCTCGSWGEPQETRDLAVAEAGRHVRRGSISIIDLRASSDQTVAPPDAPRARS